MSSPTIAHGRVYVGANARCGTVGNFGGKLFCFGLGGGPPIWEQPFTCDVRGCPLVIGDRVYISTGVGLYCFNAFSGDPIVSHVGPLEWYSSFAASYTPAETFMYIGDGGQTAGSHSIWCLDLDLNEVWRFYTPNGTDCWSSPAISAGRVLMCSNGGGVYCFREAGRPRTQPVVGSFTARVSDGDVSAVGAGVPSVSLEMLPSVSAGCVRIRYDLGTTAPTDVRLHVFDTAGRHVGTLMSGTAPERRGMASWMCCDAAGQQLPDGMYYFRLTCGSEVATKAVLVIR